MCGIFISAEGTDGAGKSTQLEFIKKYLEERKKDAVFLREPGGNAISEKIRNVILDTENIAMTPQTEALLYAASRIQLVNEVIVPALEEGKIVVCDRYIDSSIAYQGYGRKLTAEKIEEINGFAISKCMPDMTLFFDLPPEKGILRKKNQHDLDRMEQESLDFHNRVYEGYISLSEKYPKRIKRIDASMSVEKVWTETKKCLDELFEKLSEGK